MDLIEKLQKEPSLIKTLPQEDLQTLAREIRETIINTVSENGGHLSSNLGIVELTIALHKIFNIPPDKIIWDVGHQCYTHKLLTGRLSSFHSLRQGEGMSGFPCPEESCADTFKTGHAGTAVSAAAGLKAGQEMQKDNSKVIAVIGDGSLTNGITFEGLNFLGALSKNMLIILNDNKMSISSTKGALSYYLAKLATSPFISRQKEEFEEIVSHIPSIGKDIVKIAHEAEKKTKYLLIPGVFFEKLGLRYIGPIDGHDIKQLLEILNNIKTAKGNILLHIVTKKGKGYKPAEENPADFHGAAPFNKETGLPLRPTEPSPGKAAGDTLEILGEKDRKLIVLTAAMEKGLGLEGFASKYPERFFDVGIAESHCAIFASGLAKAGMKVVVAIYSTFIQRCYDQIMHDICLQKLPVVFLIDRAGVVGEDGPTHHGIFDICFLRTIPGLELFAPPSVKDLKETLILSLKAEKPVFIRFPKGFLPEDINPVEQEKETLVLGCGSMSLNAMEACKMMKKLKNPPSFYPVNRIKPLEDSLSEKIKEYKNIITLEEGSVEGGFGSAVCDKHCNGRQKTRILKLGLPDKFIEQGKRSVILQKYGLSPEKIAEKIEDFIK